MKKCTHRQGLLLAALCGILFTISTNAQTYVRYINQEDLDSKVLYADSVLTSIALPHGVARLGSYPELDQAVEELKAVLADPTKEILKVRICASTSPDGLWGDNEVLSQARLDAALAYLTSKVHINRSLIHTESLVEDWVRLYEILENSDIPCRDQVLNIIRTKSWGARKTALQQLEGGRIWKILEKEYFPMLRCVRFAIFCKWDPSKPYLSAPETPKFQTSNVTPVVPVAAPQNTPQVVREIYREVYREVVRDTVYRTDTVYVKEEVIKRDTIYVLREMIEVPQQIVPVPTQKADVRPIRMPREKKEAVLHDTPWMMGIKTNLLADAIAVPMVGLEIQLSDRMSLNLDGWYTGVNMFNKADENTNFYGFSPELRWWFNGNTMRQGSFIGLHARLAWYTLQWRDGLLYQNGPENMWVDNYHDAGNSTPAWSAGMTYGYSLGLGRTDRWGLEFLVGVGYAKYRQNTAAYNGNIWEFVEHQNNNHFGITRASINLSYRFSVRKVKPEYYQDK